MYAYLSISAYTIAYNLHNIQNNARDWEWKKNDLLSCHSKVELTQAALSDH